MMMAIVADQSTEANPGLVGLCPGCRGAVRAKCGPIKCWHWAHIAADCDPWWEQESEWHQNIKRNFPAACREVVRQNHRADILTASGWVIELQHSHLPAPEIKERERFWGRMVWVVDGHGFAKNLLLRPKNGHLTFRWKWPRLTWSVAERPVFIDLPQGLFRMVKMYPKTPCGGWGRLTSWGDFLAWARKTS